MKNTDIKYELSTDYKRLYQLLKDQNILIGFIAIDIDGVPNMDFSKLDTFSYNFTHKYFDLGFTFFEADFDKIGFEQMCKKQNVRFLDIDESK